MSSGENTMDHHQTSNEDDMLLTEASMNNIIEKTEHLNMTSEKDSLAKGSISFFLNSIKFNKYSSLLQFFYQIVKNYLTASVKGNEIRFRYIKLILNMFKQSCW